MLLDRAVESDNQKIFYKMPVRKRLQKRLSGRPWLGSVVVRASDLWSTGCECDSRPCTAWLVPWVGDRLRADKPSRYVTSHLGQLSLPSIRGREIEYRSLAGVKAGCVHLCRVAGNTVWSHMTSDGRLSWPSWIDSAPAGNRTSDLSITSPTPNHCPTVSSDELMLGMLRL